MTVEDRLSRWLSVLRVVVLLDATVVDLRHLDDYRHPHAVVACLGVMVLWTCVASWAYLDARWRGPVLLVADLVIAVVLVLLTPVLKGPDFFSTVPGFWVVGATLAWAMHYRWRGGLFAAAVVCAADLSVRSGVDQINTGNLFLLLVSGPLVGFMVDSLVQMAEARDVAQRESAAAAERARLARAVHDGVLQVLALAQRRGGEAGGDTELGELAAEQEAALRLLIREQEAVAPDDLARNAPVDLVARLLPLGARPAVEVVTPGVGVPLPVDVVAELTAAVTACLDNTAQHASGARAWVVVEDGADRVCVTVRDEGAGIAPGRLRAAAAAGRYGVSQSICGRLTDLGGTATLSTGPDGTEWELVVPRSREVSRDG